MASGMASGMARGVVSGMVSSSCASHRYTTRRHNCNGHVSYRPGVCAQGWPVGKKENCQRAIVGCQRIIPGSEGRATLESICGESIRQGSVEAVTRACQHRSTGIPTRQARASPRGAAAPESVCRVRRCLPVSLARNPSASWEQHARIGRRAGARNSHARIRPRGGKRRPDQACLATRGRADDSDSPARYTLAAR